MPDQIFKVRAVENALDEFDRQKRHAFERQFKALDKLLRNNPRPPECQLIDQSTGLSAFYFNEGNLKYFIYYVYVHSPVNAVIVHKIGDYYEEMGRKYREMK